MNEFWKQWENIDPVNGLKTIGSVIGLLVSAGMFTVGVIDVNALMSLMALFNATGLFGVAHKIEKAKE